ncbi:RNA polymerase II subunit A C-terminal domain phosphatase [[Candida] jaroonii]|uniref:RNA polymerase II subunit A C-terminal domain phosphatase n=1 Tax=[Candida] jaroonii TaxID=467808 RepID=A0ACA9Y7E3_9ASCO|nr:RNA polymerase II subunit A C-terminal domain phosphatase [[Candida] jaroonii]
MSEAVSITLPPSVPFPVTISSIMCKEQDDVRKHQMLFKYKYWDYQDDPHSKEEIPPKIRVEMIGTHESPVEGKITQVLVKLNEEIGHKGIVLCLIEEPCAHAVQYGGLCALCGKAVEDEKDYTGYNYEDRATISMSHENTGLKISYEEATKIEQNTTDRLLKEEKLILVVDLDQTVIQATVDPTISEWQKDPTNPNYKAAQEVKSFYLEEEPIVTEANKLNGIKPQPLVCWYYVKLRPGLKRFLQEMSKYYEMHIYTMATRNYALAIAKLIDPEGKYFGDRILSRDESGSLTHKNLKRLFPVDQSMVAIIDDRGDVWQWESNLIKVVPYDFFVGIGDINSSFLPKKFGQVTGPSKRRKSLAKLEAYELGETKNEKVEETPKESPKNNEDEEDKENPKNPVDRMLEIGGGEDNKNLLIEQSQQRSLSIEQQQHDRPLAKLQHDLEKINHQESEDEDEDEEIVNDNLLYDDDTELETLQVALTNIYKEYYKMYKSGQTIKPDLTKIIPQLKSKCLKGLTILFSGILPINIPFENLDLVILCKQFGATVVNEVLPEVTHVICKEPIEGQGLTLKVKIAKDILPNVKIVNSDWLFSSLSNWKKMDESKYLIKTSDNNWRIDKRDVADYQRNLNNQIMMQKNRQPRPRFDSITSIEDYDLDNANQEVDDFLADLSGDEDDDDDDDDEDDEDDEEQPSKVDSFIKDVYKSKKRTLEIESDEEVSKKHKSEDLELDELEQELLDGFDELD